MKNQKIYCIIASLVCSLGTFALAVHETQNTHVTVLPYYYDTTSGETIMLLQKNPTTNKFDLIKENANTHTKDAVTTKNGILTSLGLQEIKSDKPCFARLGADQSNLTFYVKVSHKKLQNPNLAWMSVNQTFEQRGQLERIVIAAENNSNFIDIVTKGSSQGKGNTMKLIPVKGKVTSVVQEYTPKQQSVVKVKSNPA